MASASRPAKDDRPVGLPVAVWPSERAGWYVTILLTVAYTFSFVDRQVLNLLVEPIQTDLLITDTQISFLQGIAFVAAYVLMSVPIGRLVDRFNRVAVLIGGVLIWSATTIGCGLAGSYLQLMVARIGVGFGEASVTPASWSLLADYFRPERLARPVSVFLMGPYLGAGLALIVGAEVIDWTRSVDALSLPVIGAVSAWQFTFIAVGVPGVLVAGLLASIREPQRMGQSVTPEAAVPWAAVYAFLRGHRRVYAALLLGVPFIVVMLYGLQAWVPTFLVRAHEWDLARAGRTYGLIALLAGSAGVLSGPYLGNWLRGRGHEDYPLRVAVIGAGLATAAMLMLPWCPDGESALVFVTLASFSVTLPLALVTYALQTVTPNKMRGVIAGLFVVTVNVMGLALGPTLVALATVFVFADPRAVGYSLAIVSAFMGPVAMLLLASGMKSYAEMATQPG